MAIALLTQPGDICFARNQCIWKFRAAQMIGGDLYDAMGVYTDLSYSLSDRFTAGETVTITYTDADNTSQTVVFTAANLYTGTNQLPTNTWTGTNGDYWATVVQIIQQHPRIAPWFTVRSISVSGSLKLRMQALEVVGWVLSVANTHGFAIMDHAATDDMTPDNYKIRFEVFFETQYKSGTYEQVAQLEGLPEPGTGFCYFDISSVLEGQCQSERVEPLVPVWGTDEVTLADNLRRYYVRWTEEYGSPVVVQDWDYSAIKLVMDGGVSQTLFGLFDYLSAIDSDNSLLTWMPGDQQVILNQPVFLNWFNYYGIAVKPVVKVVWYSINDNSASAAIYRYTAGALFIADKETAIIPVSPTALGIDNQDAAYRYTVQVGFDDPEVSGFSFTALSAERTYYINRDYQRSERFVCYLNAFGVPEVWRCTGAHGKKLNIDRSVSERSLLPGYNELATERFQYAQQFDNTFTYRTGFVRREEADSLQEVLLSASVYDVSVKGYIPLLLTSNDFEVTDSNRDLHAYQFNARPRRDERNYSNFKQSALMAAWEDPGGNAWMDTFAMPWLT